jgi:hypothetical protein
MVSTFQSWISPLLTLGQRKTIQEDDMYDPLPCDEAAYLTNKLEKSTLSLAITLLHLLIFAKPCRYWNEELKKKKPNLSMALIRFCFGKMMFLTFLAGIEVSWHSIASNTAATRQNIFQI